jgi:hypothetical protein
MHTVVVFTENNARILMVEDVEPYKDWENAIIDPDLSKVRKIPPHEWKISDGKIVPMSQIERVSRSEQLKTGACNEIKPGKYEKSVVKHLFKRYYPVLLSFLIGLSTNLLFRR